MLDWWQTLNLREQRLVSLAAFVVMAGLVFVLVLEPMAQQQQTLDKRLQAERAALARIEQYTGEARKIRARMEQSQGQEIDRTQSLLAVLNKSASKHGLQDKVKRIVPNGQDKASVVFDEVVFDDFTDWIVDLQTAYGVVVDRITVDREKDEGIVRANVNLKRG